MAKVVPTEQNVVAESFWHKIRIVYIGLGLGAVWYLLAWFLNRYVVEALACHDLTNPTICIDSFGVAGSIAAIIVAILGGYALVRANQPRPIVVAIAAAVLLWDLGSFLDGMVWWWVALWAILLYAAVYSLFVLIARIRSIVTSIVVAAVVVILIRLALIL